MKPVLYKGKNGLIIMLTTIFFNILPLCFVSEILQSWLGYGILLFYYAFDLLFFPIILFNKVLLYDDYFIFYYGFRKHRFELKDIKSIEHSNSPFSASANSIDRLLINLKDQEVCVSLQKNDEFIKEVKKRAPLIQLK